MRLSSKTRTAPDFEGTRTLAENGALNKSNKFSPEVRERAVGMLQKHRGEYSPMSWAVLFLATRAPSKLTHRPQK
jgi:hypothetical protein